MCGNPVCMDGRSRRNKCGRTQQLYCKETRPLQCLRYPDKYPVGHSFDGAGGLYYLGEQPLCTVTSQIAFDYFTQDDDGKGQERGVLLESIIARLRPKNERDDCQRRWDCVWGDPLCQKYRRPEHEDFWLWNYEFFNAPVEDLRHIANLIGAK